MRQLLLVLAAATLAACETMPEFLQPQPLSGPTRTSSPAAITPPPAATPAPAPAAFAPPPDQQLLELERQVAATAQERGLGAALGGVIDPTDGMVIRPGAVYSGAEAVERGLATGAGAGPIYWQPDRVHVARSGDMGVTSGRYVQVMTGAEAVQGRYVAVWRRDGDGRWRLLNETRVPDPARAPRRR
jgi:hypothetical protein